MSGAYIGWQIAVAAAALVLAGASAGRRHSAFGFWAICGTLALGTLGGAAQGMHPPANLIVLGEVWFAAAAVFVTLRTPRRRRA